jgi:DNA-binding NarL/FixJ family response regulator
LASVTGRTVVVLGDSPPATAAVQHVLTRFGLRLVGSATRATEALSLVEGHRPDLLIADVDPLIAHVGATNWTYPTELVRLAQALAPGLRVLVLSMDRDLGRIDALLRAGADAYIVNTAAAADLATAVRQAFEFFLYIRPAVPGADPRRLYAVEEPKLTSRQLEILRLVAQGASNAQVAKRLRVTEQTVRFHLGNTYRKIGVRNPMEARRWLDVKDLAEASPSERLEDDQRA